MEGGNGVREASGITQFAEGEPNRQKYSYPIDEAETLPRKVSALGVLLDGFAVKKKARVPLTLHSRTPKDVTD